MRKLGLAIAAAALVGLFAGPAMAVKPGTKGNDLPMVSMDGAFKLQVIAYDKDHCPAGDFIGSNRHQIAVAADFFAGELTHNQANTLQRDIIRNNTILLIAGPDFEVLDGNACSDVDSKSKSAAAALQLPEDVSISYLVFVRLVGAHDTGIGVTTCAVDDQGTPTEDDDVVVCSSGSLVLLRFKKDVPKFIDATAELLTISGVDFGGGPVTVSLFDPRLEDFFWQWNTKGKAHAQLVFIPTANF